MPTPPDLDRRTLLQAAGAQALLGGLAACGPDRAPADLDSAAPDPSLDLEGWELISARIDTVVIIMMENRSFDHFLGARLLEERDDRIDGLTGEESNPHPDGGDVPVFRSDDFCVEDPPHSWNASHDQFNDGANDGFVSEFHDRDPAAAREAMGYFGRDTLSAFYGLADHYAVCDRWFSSVMSSTWPNRFYSHCAQNGGVTGNSWSSDPTPSIYPTLEASGVSWACYYGNAPFMLILPDIVPEGGHLQGYEAFFEAAEAGTLPNVVLVDPIFGRADDHPPAHPVAGQVFISTIYDALARSPQWDRMLVLITYDEHGGFYDHVAPPKAADDRAADGFDQLGFRVPTLAVGPWVKRDHVSHVVRDHASILAFIEARFGVEPLTARDAAADPLDELLDVDRMRSGVPAEPATLDPIEADEAELYAEECLYLVRPGPRDPYVTRQPELEAVLDARIAGTGLDRRDQTDRVWGDLLGRAEARGLLRRRGPTE